jgi:hypothetical protein
MNDIIKEKQENSLKSNFVAFLSHRGGALAFVGRHCQVHSRHVMHRRIV